MRHEWLDMGALWAETRQWILAMRRRESLTRESAAREWALMNACLGADRGVADLRRWFADVVLSDLKETIIDAVRLQFTASRKVSFLPESRVACFG